MFCNTVCVYKTYAHCNMNNTAGGRLYLSVANSVCDNDFLLHDCKKKDNYLYIKFQSDKSVRE